MAYIYDLTDTWSAAGTVFNGIKLNVTNTASAAASKLVTLQVGGTEHFSVTKAGVGYFSGNVGIGTSSPIAKLDVVGAANTYARINDGTVNLVLQSYTTGSSAIVGTTSNHALTLWSNAAERMRIDPSGNVGIGTSSPLVKLDVDGSINARSGTITADNFVNWGSNLVIDAGGSLPIIFKNNGTESARIINGGNVGIGTSSPTNRLSVSNAGAQGFEIDPVTGANGGISTLAFNRGTASWLSLTQYASDFRWDNGGTEQMRIDSTGNVGIGTASPGATLTLQAANNFPFINWNNSSNTQIAFAGWHGGGGGDFRMGTVSTTAFAFQTNNAERMRIDASGNLLVGTTSAIIAGADTKVAVVDNFQFKFGASLASTQTSGTSNFINFVYNGTSVGSISSSSTTTTYATSSDVRLKDNITDADDAASLIDAIQVRKFDWKADGSHQRYGFIAQELVTVAPEAVSQPADPDAMMGVDYSKLVPMLVKEIQSMRLRLAQLEGN